MFDPAGDGSGSAEPAARSRYVYLLGRLRGRQITMEEATELFGIMQGMIRAASASGPPPDTSGSPPPPPPPPPGTSVLGGPSEDLYWISLLAIGAGAGLGAAVMKRAMGGPPPAGKGPKSSASDPR